MADTYLDFWNITQPLFMDSSFGEGVFVTEQMNWIKDHILEDYAGKSKVLAVSGDSGVGKSRLSEWLYKDLPLEGYEVVYWSVVRKRPVNSERFLFKLASFFGVDDLEYSPEVEKLLADSLDTLREEGKTLVMLIDACEHLNFEEDLKSLASLINLLNAAKVKHVLYMSGSKGFMESIEIHRDFVPKNIQILLLHKLTKYEMMEFIHGTCQKSGVETQSFDKDAVELLYDQTQGNFKLICLLLEASLNLSFQRKAKKVDLDTIKEVIGIANTELSRETNEETVQERHFKTSA